MRRLAALVALVAIAGCGPSPALVAEPRTDDRLRIASYDFPESRILVELYAQQLRRAGWPVQVLSGLGTRELVEPALEQGRVDLVIDYTGSLLDFLGGDPAATHGTPAAVHGRVAARLTGRGLTALAHAPAEDSNAFAVTVATARRLALDSLSDLRPVAAGLTFGGPAECQTRRYCLRGLASTYGLHFGSFRAQPTRAATAAALAAGDIDVGLLDSTDGRLSDGRLVLLTDDRGLQPRDNIVPVLRTDLVARHGTALTGPIDALTARLSTAGVIELNHTMATNPAPPADLAAHYLVTLVPR